MLKLCRNNRLIVPVEVVELEENSYHILVNCIINGNEKGCFVVDTGASKTVVDSSFLKYYNSIETELGDMYSGGLGGEIPNMKIAELKSLEFGNFYIESPHIALIDLDNINAMYQHHCNRSINGLLGSDILVKYNAVIDYGKSIISFYL